MQVDIVQGLAWGDEGKGKVTADLARTGLYTHCLRYNGGPNAGHTIHLDDGSVAVTHSIPSGVLFGLIGLIGPGCVIHIDSFFDELNALEEVCPGVSERISIHPRAHVITDLHVEMDRANDKIGSTGRGISYVYADKMLRTGKQALKFSELWEFINKDAWDWSNNVTILAEGAQGIWLDPDIGDYPFVTSSSCLPGAVNSSFVPVTAIEQIWGVAKAYDTYVGKNVFQNPLDSDLNLLQTTGKEFGATTGRVRQCSWLNLTRLCRAIKITGTTQLVINKVDILEEINIFKTSFDGRTYNFNSIREWMDFVARTIFLETQLEPENVLFSGNPTRILESNL